MDALLLGFTSDAANDERFKSALADRIRRGRAVVGTVRGTRANVNRYGAT